MDDRVPEIVIAALWMLREFFRYKTSQRDKHMAGIAETKEVLVAGNEIGLFVVSRLKDGVGVDDALAAYQKLTQDAAFKKIVMDAHDGLSAVGGEIKDLDIGEGLELAMLQMSYIPKYVDVLK
jgi:hypothetical protein